MEKEKTELETKIEALQHEVQELRSRITMAVNNNESLEKQIVEVRTELPLLLSTMRFLVFYSLVERAKEHT